MPGHRAVIRRGWRGPGCLAASRFFRLDFTRRADRFLGAAGVTILRCAGIGFSFPGDVSRLLNAQDIFMSRQYFVPVRHVDRAWL
jgi:hypothetical protein